MVKITGKIKFIGLLVMLIVLFFLDVYVGNYKLDLLSILDPKSVDYDIFINFKLPKTLVAILTGMALSLGGLQMQTIFRNPLADPYILGVSSGAGLGVAIFLMGFSTTLLHNFAHNLGIYLSASIGAAFVLAVIIAVSHRVKDIMVVLILGVLLGSAISALISILQYFSSQSMLKTYIVWTMGSLGNVTYDKLLIMFLAITVGVIISVFSIKPLNAFLLGENYAKSIGVKIKRSRNIVFVATSILVGTVTAFCGPIAFVGIAVPHIARAVFKTSDHRILTPAVILIGAVAMLFCDIVAHSFKTPLPINSITSLLGIPIIIVVLIKYKQ